MLEDKTVSTFNTLLDDSRKLYIVEIGAAVPVSHSLLLVPGASKVIYHTECPYASAASKYNITSRMVSSEAVTQIVDHLIDEYRAGSHGRRFNSILVTSFQIRSESEDTKIPHGWVAYAKKEEHSNEWTTEVFHLTIADEKGKYFNRLASIDLILDDVLSILNGTDSFKFVDIMVNKDQSLLSRSKSHLLAFQDGVAVRLEDISRGAEICLYKGSFNPLHEGHLQIAANVTSAEIWPKRKVVFAISRNTYGKGLINDIMLLNRIKDINRMGYSVLVFNIGFFFDNSQMLINRTGKSIQLAMGVDTFNRLINCYYIHEYSDWEKYNINPVEYYFSIEECMTNNRAAHFKKNFSQVHFIVFGRNNEPIRENDLNPTYTFIDFDVPISSTMLREAQTKERVE